MSPYQPVNEMSFLEATARILKCPPERVTLVEDSSAFDVGAIRQGVVICFAMWSGPAHVALKAYTEKLSDLPTHIPVWVLDVDTLRPDIYVQLGWVQHGNGETFFYNHGVLVDSQLNPAGDCAAIFVAKWQACFA
jgi:hypothetical protein